MYSMHPNSLGIVILILILSRKDEFTMAKNYKLYALVFFTSNGSIQSVNNSYYAESMNSAQSLFENDLKKRGIMPLVILSDAQVKRKILSRN